MTIEITEEIRARLKAREFAVQQAVVRVTASPTGEDIPAVARPIYEFLVEDLDKTTETQPEDPAPTEGDSTVTVEEPTA